MKVLGFVVFGLMIHQIVKALVSTTDQTDLLFSTGDIQGCVCHYNSSIDYFPIKPKFNYAKGFSISYYKHYKIIYNLNTGLKYYGYLCGTPVPTVPDTDANTSLVVELPLQKVALTSTTYIPYMEYIKQRENIVALESTGAASPCVETGLQNGRIVNFSASLEIEATGIYIDYTKLNSSKPSYVFCGFDCYSINSNKTSALPITVSETSEATLLGVAEWVYYFAAFFNREQAAYSVAGNIATRYDCNAGFVSSANITTRPKVLFPSYYEGVWYISTNETWVGGIVTSAGGQLVPSRESYNMSNLTERIEFENIVKQAEIFIFDGNFLETLKDNMTANFNMSEFYNNLTSSQVKNNIYDNARDGPYSWFEKRPAEPDLALIDFILIFHPNLIPKNHFIWFRNIVLEPGAINNQSSLCVNENDYSAPLYTDWKTDECNQYSSTLVTIDGIQSAMINDCSFAINDANNDENQRTLAVEIAVPIGVFFLLVALILAVYCHRKKKLAGRKKEKITITENMKEGPEKILDTKV